MWKIAPLYWALTPTAFWKLASFWTTKFKVLQAFISAFSYWRSRSCVFAWWLSPPFGDCPKGTSKWNVRRMIGSCEQWWCSHDAVPKTTTRQTLWQQRRRHSLVDCSQEIETPCRRFTKRLPCSMYASRHASPKSQSKSRYAVADYSQLVLASNILDNMSCWLAERRRRSSCSVSLHTYDSRADLFAAEN